MDIEKEIEELKKRLNKIEIYLTHPGIPYQTIRTKTYGQPVPSQTNPRTETVFTPRLFDSGKRAKSESIGRPAIEIGQGE